MNTSDNVSEEARLMEARLHGIRDSIETCFSWRRCPCAAHAGLPATRNMAEKKQPSAVMRLGEVGRQPNARGNTEAGSPARLEVTALAIEQQVFGGSTLPAIRHLVILENTVFQNDEASKRERASARIYKAWIWLGVCEDTGRFAFGPSAENAR